MSYDSKGILVFNLKYEHAISFINLVKFINYYQMPRSISTKLFVIASGEANVYGSYALHVYAAFFYSINEKLLLYETGNLFEGRSPKISIIRWSVHVSLTGRNYEQFRWYWPCPDLGHRVTRTGSWKSGPS
jgi:hypothetical protein